MSVQDQKLPVYKLIFGNKFLDIIGDSHLMVIALEQEITETCQTTVY